ncbi:hypothetical protein V6N13_113001 [Hibiscus sabdariffa]
MSTTRARTALGPPDFQGPPGAHRTPRDDRLTHVQVPFTWNLSPLRPSKFSFEYLLLPPRSAPTGRSARAHAPGFTATAAPSYSSGPGPCPRRPGIVHALKRHPFSGLVDSAVLLTKNGPLGALDSVARLNEAAAPSYLFKTPWSVFQDGPDGEPAGRRPEHAVPKHAETARAGFHDRGDDVSTGVSKARAWAATPHPPRHARSTPPEPASRRSPIGGIAVPASLPTISRALFDSLSKSLHLSLVGTCRYCRYRSLAPYLALDGIYRPIRAAFPNNPTRRQRLVVRTGSGHDGALSPSPAPLSRDLGPVRPEDASPDYNSDAEGDRFSSSKGYSGSLELLTRGVVDKAEDVGSASNGVGRGDLGSRREHRACGAERAGFDNDPSAGSPTEPLLRLLLPLNDKVQWTSRDVAGSEPPTSPRSEHFTGPFNRPALSTLIFFKVTAPEERTRPIKARSASPAVGTSRPVLTVRRDRPTTPRSNYELFNCNNLNIRYWSWNYRGCWHPDLPSNGSSLRDLDCTHSNYQTRRARINQVAFLRDVRPAWSSTHYLGRGEAITRREHRSCRGTKCTSYERTGPRPYAHEIFRIRKHDRASMHRRSRIMSIDTLGTPGTTEVHQAATRSLDGQGMAIHPKFHRFRYATQDPYRTPWARRPQGEDIEE